MRTLATLLAAAAIATFGFAGTAHAADFVVDLTADNGDGLGGILVGDVTVSGVSGDFDVIYDTSASSLGNGDWLIVELHLHVTNNDVCADVPQTGNNNPKVGKFDFRLELTPNSAVDNFTFNIDLDGGGNDIVCIAAHAVVFDDTDGGATPEDRFNNTEETAWGDGDGGTEFSNTRNWATFFTVDLSTL